MSIPINDATVTIQLAMDSIRNDDIDVLQVLFEKMPLEQLSRDDVTRLMTRFITIAAHFDRPEAIPIILREWERVQSPGDNIDFYPLLFLESMMTVDLLRFVSAALPDSSYMDVMDELISYDSNETVLLACQKALAVYGEQPVVNYKTLMESADDRGNNVIYNFMVSKIEDVNEFAPIPPWVKNFRPDNSLPRESELQPPPYQPPSFEIPDIETIVRLLTEGLEAHGITFEDIEEAKNVLRGRLNVATLAEKVLILSPIMEIQSLENLQNNTELFRILGPANPLYDSDATQMKYGGSRMFIANEFDFNEEIGFYDDWFRGACDHCHLRIRYRWHAIRMPRPHGGWLGCYCSFECLRGGLDQKELDEERPDLVTRNMIDSIEDQFEDIGIQDRLPDVNPIPIDVQANSSVAAIVAADPDQCPV